MVEGQPARPVPASATATFAPRQGCCRIQAVSHISRDRSLASMPIARSTTGPRAGRSSYRLGSCPGRHGCPASHSSARYCLTVRSWIADPMGVQCQELKGSSLVCLAPVFPGPKVRRGRYRGWLAGRAPGRQRIRHRANVRVRFGGRADPPIEIAAGSLGGGNGEEKRDHSERDRRDSPGSRPPLFVVSRNWRASPPFADGLAQRVARVGRPAGPRHAPELSRPTRTIRRPVCYGDRL